VDAPLADATRLQMGADAERHVEGKARPGRGELPDQIQVQVVVVIVRDDDRVEIRQLVPGERHRLEPGRPEVARGRAPLGPDGIEE